MSSVTRIKCVVIGDSGVGKTSMIMRYITKAFPSESETKKTLENHILEIVLNDRKYELTIYDTSGKEDLIRLKTRASEGEFMFVICFDINNSQSWGNARQKWFNELRTEAGVAPFILVGTKCDLPSKIKKSSVKYLANKYKSCYIICSAKSNISLDKVFKGAVIIYQNWKYRKVSLFKTMLCW